jgi:hypothetical protein
MVAFVGGGEVGGGGWSTAQPFLYPGREMGLPCQLHAPVEKILGTHFRAEWMYLWAGGDESVKSCAQACSESQYSLRNLGRPDWCICMSSTVQFPKNIWCGLSAF